ncbi:MAG TPA: glycoside hydrolase family 15 protein [Opitutaceae bacterium]|nr:glycoside hydrolase family 15 protein [Opitutaceae bacterium]
MRIEDYGIIGDTHTAALVGLNGSIDWFCVPRFDSDACFARLLGDEENGFWQIAPADPAARSRQAYRDETLVLETEFETAEGAVRVIDGMAMSADNRQVLRVVEGRRGRVKMAMKLVIRFDHGERIPWVRRDGERITAVAGPQSLVLDSEVPTRGEGLSTVAEFTIREGESKAFALSWHFSHLPPPPPPDARRLLRGAEKFWHGWARHCTYRGEFRTAVVRSLVTLKALTYGPTGGIVAAPTTSLPERIGGVRNWDYRYCWLRDATVTLFALMSAGYREEAAGWIEWLLRSVAGDPAQLQIMYGMMGERLLTEIELPHLAGYEGSKPVRKGNAAAEQFQLDVFGELMDALFQARRMKIRPKDDPWPLQCHLVEFVTKHWTEPDEGIWEIRGPRRHFTHSKMMAWVAIDRAVRTIEEFGADGPLAEWRALRGRIHADICAQGYDSERGVFTQSYGAKPLDGSLLLMPLVGFLPPDDPRVVRTIEAIDRELRADGLVLRYHPDTSAKIDGLPPGEGAFLPCSFWMVDCLNLLGRREEAEERFRHLLTLCSPLGLLAEEYDPRARRQLGNFPQAYSHVGLVNSAQNLAQGPTPVGQRMDGHTIVTHSQP